jgi:DNA-nicking Smr family endonuclease
MAEKDESSIEFPVDGTLDLHTFRPDEIKRLIPDYIDECLARGILKIRIIHGKGKGVLRRIVHSALDKHPAVAAYRHESGSGGSWGATVVDLKKPT